MRRDSGGSRRHILRWMWHLVNSVRNHGCHRTVGVSMEPGICFGDRLLVTLTPHFEYKPKRGDIVVVNEPGEGKRHFLKRLVGLPGETVMFDEGLMWIDGKHLAEPYLNGLPAALGLGYMEWILTTGEYFVLGDNRFHSTDSRAFGPIILKDIVGKAWFRYWPYSKIGRLR
ncbi:signal peptidase I [Dehalococcoidia bacterium]|nr:signal peptidase I [Dehalococcoidia bacterium]